MHGGSNKRILSQTVPGFLKQYPVVQRITNNSVFKTFMLGSYIIVPNVAFVKLSMMRQSVAIS